MRIDIISVIPELLSGPFEHSILKRASDRGLLEVVVHDLKDYGIGKHRKIDDYPYGGDAGMVMMVEPIEKCIHSLKKQRDYSEVIYLTPDGENFDQSMANQLSLSDNMILLCGHYKGVDERVREHFITKEISIGDYVLSGGELAAAVIVDSVGRLIPGVLNDETSALFDSFQDGLVAPPIYTRPADYNGWKVPDILLSGHEAKIEEWKFKKSLERTRQRRPGLVKED